MKITNVTGLLRRLEMSISGVEGKNRTQKVRIRSLEKQLGISERRVSGLKKARQHLEAKLRQLEAALTERTIVQMPNDPISKIMQVVAEVCGVPVASLASSATRRRSEIFPQQLGMSFCLEYGAGSCSDVAPRFGKKDHSSAFYAKKAVEAMMTERFQSIQRDQYMKCQKLIEARLGFVRKNASAA